MRRRGKKAAEGWKKYWVVGGKGGGGRKWVARKKQKTRQNLNEKKLVEKTDSRVLMWFND